MSMSVSEPSNGASYVCQYIEIRKSDTNAAAWWLGIHTGLAFLRVVVWIWDPDFDNFALSYSLRKEPTYLTVSTLASIYFHDYNRRSIAEARQQPVWKVHGLRLITIIVVEVD